MSNKEQIAADFKQWVEEPVSEKFKDYEIFGDRILVRLYYFDASKYNPKKAKVYKSLTSNENLLDEMASKLFPIGKVLSVGTGVREPWSQLTAGELVILPDRVTGTIVNKEWVEYQALALEKPGLKDRVAEPPRMVGGAMQWKDDVFMEDKFEEVMRMEDAMTFLLQERYILGKYNL